MKNKAIYIVPWGGLGDLLLCTPSLKALKDVNRGRKLVVICRRKGEKEILENNPDVDKLKMLSFLSDPIAYLLFRLRWRKFLSFNYGQFMPGLFEDRKASAMIAEILNADLNDERVRIYLTEKENSDAKNILSGYRNPIAMHISASCSNNKEWPLENWKSLVSGMKNVTFIQLGLAKDEKVDGAIDLRGASIRQSFAIIRNSIAFVGVDSLFSHATNAFDIPGVVIFGPSTPKIWGHANNINLYKKIRCSPCLDLLLNISCPYRKVCMTAVTVDDVITALGEQIGDRAF